jgi:hypothetical protein
MGWPNVLDALRPEQLRGWSFIDFFAMSTGWLSAPSCCSAAFLVSCVCFRLQAGTPIRLFLRRHHVGMFKNGVDDA